MIELARKATQTLCSSVLSSLRPWFVYHGLAVDAPQTTEFVQPVANPIINELVATYGWVATFMGRLPTSLRSQAVINKITAAARTAQRRPSYNVAIHAGRGAAR